ncbi:MAG: PD-(D/E)XK nuclease family protein [Pseudoclavibacter sp.]|nr:PD-(D/E)XK nuclease family protein [Pseudoclavibacter sp.]
MTAFRSRADPSQLAVLSADPRRSISVVGAAGSGKTATLVELAAERVERGTTGVDELVALVPDRRRAARLRDLLAVRIGRVSGGVLARTPQSLAFQIVRRDRAARDAVPPRLITGADQDALLRELLAGAEDPAPPGRVPPGWCEPVTAELLRLRGFRAEMRDLLAVMSEFDVTPEQLAGLAGRRAVWDGAARLAREVQESLDWQGGGVFDTPGLLLEAASLVLSEPASARQAPRLVLVDDAQELTEAARRFLAALESAGAVVASFGDPDTATGVFRGGRAEHAVGWRGSGPAPDRFVLERVHRHGPGLRRLVTQTVGRIGVRGEGRQRRAEAAPVDEGTGGAPGVLPEAAKVFAPSPVAEAQAIAGLLRERHLGAGVPWGQTAVLVRSGSAIPALARLLARAEVPTSATRPQPAGEDAAVQCLVALAQAAASAAAGADALDAELLADALASPLFAVDGLRLRQLRRALRFEELAAGGERSSDELLVEAIASPAGLAGIDPAADPLERFGEDPRFRRHPAVLAAGRLGRMLRAAIAVARRAGAADEVLWALWEGAGVAEAWRARALADGPEADRANARLDAVATLFDVAKRFVERAPDAPIGAFLEEWRARDVADDTLARRSGRDAVVLATPASVVGLEFDTVVAAGVNDGVWPDLRIRDTLLGAQELAEIVSGRDPGREHADRRREVLDDERRMFAQAISRARRHVFVTAVNGEDAQPSAFARAFDAPRLDPEQLPGPGTLRSLAAGLRNRAVRTGGEDAAAVAGLAELARAGVPGACPEQWLGHAPRTTLAPVQQTDEGGAPLVRVSPSAIGAFERCGVDWFVSGRGGDAASLPMALGTIVHEVAEHDFPDDGARRAHAHARLRRLRFDAPWQAVQQGVVLDALLDSLSDYLADRRRRSVVVVGVERPFAVEIASRDAGEPRVELRGKIDRIEQDAEGTITILDFKTFKRAPSAAEVAEDPQLAGYQLAYRSGAIDARRERPHAPGAPAAPSTDRGGEVPRDAPLGGAGLIALRVRTNDGPWRLIEQEAMDERSRLAFEERVRAAAAGMTGRLAPEDPEGEPRPPLLGGETEGPVYLADPEGHCRNRYRGGACAVHAVPEITE